MCYIYISAYIYLEGHEHVVVQVLGHAVEKILCDLYICVCIVYVMNKVQNSTYCAYMYISIYKYAYKNSMAWLYCIMVI